MALTDKLTAIADATRAKTGTTNQMTLDEIATAINGISIANQVRLLAFPMSTSQYATVTLDYSTYSQYIDMNFPYYLVFVCYVTGISGFCGKVVKVDTNKSTIGEVATVGQFGSSATLYYSMDTTKVTISTNSTSKMTFSQTGKPGYIYMFGVQK